MPVREAVRAARRIVIKIGSSSLTSAGGGLDRNRVESLVEAVSAVDAQIVLVSSGAIAAGMSGLELPNRPSAVVAISDKTALGAMEAIRESGLRIPQDISIAGIDDIAESAFTRPPLTTIHIPKYEMGVVALRKLDRLIEGEPEIPVQSLVYSELVVRESCAPHR